MDFKTPKELLDFVLIKCGGMNYKILNEPRFFTNNLDLYPKELRLNIYRYEPTKVAYAISLLKELFDTKIHVMLIFGQNIQDSLANSDVYLIEIYPEKGEKINIGEISDSLKSIRVKSDIEYMHTYRIEDDTLKLHEVKIGKGISNLIINQKYDTLKEAQVAMTQDINERF